MFNKFICPFAKCHACQRTTYVCIDIKQYKATDEAYPITKLGINDIISVRH